MAPPRGIIMKKRKIAIFILLAVFVLSAAVGGVMAAWITGARLDGNTLTIGSIDLEINDSQGGTIPMSKSLNWVDVDYNNLDYDGLDALARENKVAKGEFSITNTCEKPLDVTVTFDTTDYTNVDGVEDCIVAWLYEGNSSAIVSGALVSEMVTRVYRCSPTFEAGVKRDYTLFMVTPSSLMNGFVADKTYKFDIVASGALSAGEPELEKIELDTRGVTTEYYVYDTFSYDGIKVTGVYNDGIVEPITSGYTVTEPDMTTPGVKKVTVTYGELTADYEITVVGYDNSGDMKFAASRAITNNCALQESADGEDGYIIDGIVSGSTITYNVYSSYEGFVKLALSVAGSKTDRKMFTISVNGNAVNNFFITQDSTSFNETIVGNVSLVEGKNTIEIMGETSATNYNPKVNYLLISPMSYNGEALTLEAEHAILESCSIGTRGNASGGYAVSGMTQANGSKIVFKFNSIAETAVELYLAVATSSATSNFVTVHVGDQVFSLDVTATGGNSTFKEFFVGYVMLTVGENIIEVHAENIASGNFVDCLRMEPISLMEGTYTGDTKRYEAEHAATENCNPPQTSGQTTFVGGIRSNRSIITFTFNSEVSGLTELRLSLAGVNPIENAFDIYLNEENVYSYNFKGTGSSSWTDFKEFAICCVELQKGINKIEIRVVRANDNLNFDYLSLTPANVYEGNEVKFGVANAMYENCNLEHNELAQDGNFLGGIGSYSVITYTIHSTLEQAVELSVSVASGTGDSGSGGWANPLEEAFELYVNGVSFGKFNAGPTGWTEFKEMVLGYVMLNKGDNIIEIKAVNAQGNLNFNYLKVAPITTDNVYSGSETQIQASSAILHGGCNYQESLDIIGDIGAGNTITFALYCDTEGLVDILLNVAGEMEFSIEVWVNGVRLGDEITTTTGGWFQYNDTNAGSVMLNEGVNIIEIRTSTGGFNFSHLTITPAE